MTARKQPASPLDRVLGQSRLLTQELEMLREELRHHDTDAVIDDVNLVSNRLFFILNRCWRINDALREMDTNLREAKKRRPNGGKQLSLGKGAEPCA